MFETTERSQPGVELLSVLLCEDTIGSTSCL